MSEPVARSPIEPLPPVLVVEGWEVSGHRAQAGLTLTDCTPLAKVQVRAPIGGRAAAELAVPFGRAARDPGGTLVAGSGPGEWLLLAAPGEGRALTARATGLAARCPGELVTATDVTHGRALVRLTGPPAAPPLMPNVGPIDGCLIVTVARLPMWRNPWPSPTVVVVFPSPSGVGVIAVTTTYFAFGAPASSSIAASLTFTTLSP